MNRVVVSLIGLGLCLGLGACRSGPSLGVFPGAPSTVQRLGPKTLALRTDRSQALDLIPRAGARLGYDRHELDGDELVLRAPTERAFFSLLGEQERHQEARVRLRSRSNRVEIQVEAALIHGPIGGPFQRKLRGDPEWYDRFFEAVRLELYRLNLRSSHATPGE